MARPFCPPKGAGTFFIFTSNPASVFNSSLSSTDTAQSTVESLVGRIGANLKFTEGSIGLEYQQAFYAHRLMVRVAGHF